MEFASPLSTIPNRVISLAANLRTLIHLRWFAVAGVGAALAIAYWFEFDLPYQTLIALTIILAVLNAINAFSLSRVTRAELAELDNSDDDSGIPPSLLVILFAQIATDWILLTAFLHFSGGMMNPFLVMFVLHMIIGVSLVDFNLTYILAGFGMLLITTASFLELTGVLQYHPLISNIPPLSELPIIYVIAMLSSLAIVLVISGGMTFTLVQGIRDRERRLLKMSQDLVALSKIRTDFLFRVTHELKSPVAAMMSAVDAVKILSSDCLEPRANEMLTRIRRRGEGLLGLINDLLEIARLSTPSFQMELKPVNPEPLLEVICEMEEIKAHEKNIKLNVSIADPPVVLAEESSLREVFSNLVSNAVRYTREDGTVTVNLSSEKGAMKLEVTDTGIGISEEDQKKLYAEFFRTANAKKFTAVGTGLGLAITKQHIERFGGSISVRSVLNKGTTFTVVIPSAEKR